MLSNKSFSFLRQFRGVRVEIIAAICFSALLASLLIFFALPRSSENVTYAECKAMCQNELLARVETFKAHCEVPTEEYHDDAHVSDGQIKESTTFGTAISEIVHKPEIKRVLEVGTWRGGGSSLVIGKALLESKPLDPTARLITIEADVGFWMEAREVLRHYPVKCLLGTAIALDQIATEQDVIAEGSLSIYGDEWKKWLEGEKRIASQFEVPLVHSLCKSHTFDAILLDGGEFSGPAEFHEVMTFCHFPQYLMLHDTNSFKNKGAKKKMYDYSEIYSLYKEETTGAGWSIYELRKK